MAVPKQKTSFSSTLRQRDAKKKISHKQFESFKDKSIRQENNREKLGLNKVTTDKQAKTVVAA
jgi:ribosomal protein L32